MSIRILLPPEPTAPASRQADTILIQSAGYRQLHRELLRYCKGEVEGRSFLIAGHRGAGKTTMVNDVVLQIEKATNGTQARPVIVRLHGPNLVRPGAPDAELKAVQHALKQITLSLHRAVVQEITSCYRERVGEESDQRRRDVLYERAAQLELAADHYPQPAELREYWRAGGFLQRGVLFNDERHAPDQGFRELVALSSMVHAYARVAGIVKADSGHSNGNGTALLPDLDVATFDRVLPVLIDRIRAAGLVPVFVVDELDKIPGLYGELEGIVKHVKNIVAERAFFCFLTDRNYFERVVQNNVFDPYPKHYTYYTDRVFVSYHTDDLHRYLGDVLKPSNGAHAPGPSAPAPAPATAPATNQDEDRRDLEVLHYVLLRRSELHAIELRRQLSAWRDGGNPVTLNTAGVRSYSAYRFDLLVQFAVELILHREEVADRLRHDPALGRLLYDALYYPVRLLGQKDKEDGWAAFSRFDLKLDDTAGLEQFERYLIERMSSDREGEKQEQERKEHIDLPELGLENVDVDFLYAQLRDLVGMLADPFALMDELASDRNRMPQPSSTILQALPLNSSAGPLLRRVSDKVYEWRYGANWSFRDELVRSGKETRRGALARQLDLYMNLAVRLALASEEAQPLVGNSEHVKNDLHANLLHILQQKWLGESYEFGPNVLTSAAGSALHAASVIEILGKILSDHNEYSHRLSASNLRERYEPVRSTFSIRHAPLIAVKGNAWSFQYDRDGNPRAEKLEAAHWGDLTGVWERDLNYVLAFVGALSTLRSASPQPSEPPLDPGQLSVTLGVLRTTPSWRDVEPAVTRLTEFRSNRRFYGKFDEDASTIASYIGEVLMPGRGTLANALFAGAIIGRAATSNLHDAVVKALSLMSEAYWSGHAPSESVHVTLERVCSLLEHRWPALRSKREELRARLLHPDTDSDNQIKSSTSVVKEFLASVDQEVHFAEKEWTAFVTGAWEEWRKYFAGRFPKARFVPGVDNLLCRAAGIGPDVLLTDQPGAMPLMRWSDAFVRATTSASPTDPEYAPAWLGVFARHALGFPERPGVAADLSARTPQAFSVEELKQIALNEESRPFAAKRMLIVRAPANASAPDWSVPTGYGVLLLTPKQLEHLVTCASKHGKGLPPIDPVDHVFVEEGANGGVLKTLESGYLSRWPKRPPISAFGNSTETPSWAVRALPMPASALDLVRTADALVVSTADALPKPLADLWNPSTGMIGQVETHGDQLIVFNLRSAPNAPGELAIRSRSGSRTAAIKFVNGLLQRTGSLVRRRYRVTFDGVTVRCEQVSAALAAIDTLLPARLQSPIVSWFAGKDSLEIAAGSEPSEWRVEYRSPARNFANGRRESALLIVRSTRG